MIRKYTNIQMIPPRDGIQYLSHQREGIQWMIDREREDAPICRGGILADDMGLGKTFQTIGLVRNSPLHYMLSECKKVDTIISGH